MDIHILINKINTEREAEKPMEHKPVIEVINNEPTDTQAKSIKLLPIEEEIAKLSMQDLYDQMGVHMSWLETHAPGPNPGQDINGRDLDSNLYLQIEKRKLELVVEYFSRPLGTELEVITS